MCIMDLAEHAKCLGLNLAPIVGQPVLNTAEVEVRMDCSKVYTEEQLAPLISMVWKVQRFVDDCIHLQQAAGTTNGL